MKEIFKDIPNYEGLYQVSNLGRVRSLDTIKQYVRNNNIIVVHFKGKLLSTRIDKLGYEYCIFSNNSIRKTYKIHRLVAKTFLPNTYNKPCVNHINGIKNDNNINNLEWSTHSENTIHAFKNGLKKGVKGEKSHLSKLKLKDIKEIKNLYFNKKYTQTKIAIIFNVSQSQIGRIIRNVNWKKERNA